MSLAVRQALVASSLLLLAGTPALAEGLRLSPAAQASWSTRLVVGVDPLTSRQPVGSLLGDRFLFQRVAAGGASSWAGLRASSGWVFGAGTAALGLASVQAPADTAAQARMPIAGIPPIPAEPTGVDRWSAAPYLGIGYSHQSNDGAWGLSADLGMVATALALEFGRQPLGTARLDEAVRNLRLRPVLQLGMHYRF
jgi:hypothetical protein